MLFLLCPLSAVLPEPHLPQNQNQNAGNKIVAELAETNLG